jgi:hypothetical protein
VVHSGPDDLPNDLATLWYLVRRVGALMEHQGEELFRGELGISLAQESQAAMLDAVDPADLTAAFRVLGGLLQVLEA